MSEPEQAPAIPVAAVDAAAELCRERGVRFTETRRAVFELIVGADKPLGAYDLLQRLSETRGSTSPPTVYRALDFLAEEGLVHRIHSLNAFIACCSAGRPHSAELLLCRACGSVVETPCAVLGDHIRSHAAHRGFLAERISVEVVGLCRACDAGAGAHRRGAGR